MRTPARLANSIQLRRKLGTLNRCMGDDEMMAIKEVKKYKQKFNLSVAHNKVDWNPQNPKQSKHELTI